MILFFIGLQDIHDFSVTFPLEKEHVDCKLLNASICKVKDVNGTKNEIFFVSTKRVEQLIAKLKVYKMVLLTGGIVQRSLSFDSTMFWGASSSKA